MSGVAVEKAQELPRTLGFADALSIVVGIVIGGGIFVVPNLVARTLSSTTSILAVWVVAGIASFFGALACAELGTALPSTGGQYVYLHKIYGPLTAFVYGWTMFLVCRTAQAAWLAVTFTLYVSYFVPLSPLVAKGMGVGMILILGAINYRGVSMGALVQKSFTSAKVFGLLIIIGSAFLLHSSAPATPAATAVPFSMSSFGVALIACVLSYDGWVQVADVAGEMKNPQRNVLLALTFGVGICMGIYLLANVAYLHVLGVGGVAASDHVGASAAERVMGPAGGTLVALIILVSIVGALNGTFMTSPRVYFAQAHSGLFFQKFAEVHPQFRTPTFAILAQGGWAIVLLLTGSYETLMDYAMFAFWVFYGLMVLGVMILRRTQPDLARPYKMWGYPVTPLLFLLTTIFFLGNTAVNRPGPSTAALGLIAAGVPVYFFWKQKQKH